jgi:EAL domain-containing protein (putative c-di-GMP-specific phosphodiesterase class I)
MEINVVDRIFPVFHPVVNPFHATVYYETLLRAYTATGEKPAENDPLHARLIGVAEEVGFIGSLDLAIATQAIQQALVAKAPLGINVSIMTVETLSEELLTVVRSARSLPGGIVIEFTETIPARDWPLVLDFVRDARKIGARIALDDYGAGHFNEVDIELLRPDFLKLDITRVRSAMATEIGRKWMLQSIALAREVGAQSVAEGIDSEESFTLHARMGVDCFQGFLFGRANHLLPSTRVHAPIIAAGDAPKVALTQLH